MAFTEFPIPTEIIDLAKVSDDADRAEAARDAAEDAVQYDYLVDDGAALAALTGMIEGQRAYVRSTEHVWDYEGAAWVDQGEAATASKLNHGGIETSAKNIVLDQFAPRYLAKNNTITAVYGVVANTEVVRYTPATARVLGRIFCVVVLDLKGVATATALLRNRLQVFTDGGAYQVLGLTEYATTDDGLTVFFAEWDRSAMPAAQYIEYQTQVSSTYEVDRIEVYITEDALPDALHLRLASFTEPLTEAEVRSFAQEEAQVLVDAAVIETDAPPKNGREAIQRAATGFVDLVMLSNSHGEFGGRGLSKAMSSRLAEHFGAWATPIDQYNPSIAAVHVGFSADLGVMQIDLAEPWFVADGDTLAGDTNGGIYFQPVAALRRSPLDPTHSLRVHYGYAGFAAGSGSFSVTMRLEETPYTTIFTHSGLTTSDAADTFKVGAYDLAASAARSGTQYAVRFNHSGQTITGPFLGYYLRVEDRDVTHGICTHVAFAAGGYSLRDIATSVLAKDVDHEINYFSEIRRLQIDRGQRPNVVIVLNEGHNQRNETDVSIGRRTIADADGPLALLDNYEAIQRHYDDLWIGAGWDLDELTYVMMVDHPVSDPDDVKLSGYRDIMALYESRLPRTSVFNWLDVLTYAEMAANGSFADGLHLVNDLDAGYDFLAQRFVGYLE